jgi:hypothetical protein
MILILTLLLAFAGGETKPACDVTQGQLDAEYEASGGYEIQVEEFCEL